MTRLHRRRSLRFLLLATSFAFVGVEGGVVRAAAATPSPSPGAIVLTEGVSYRARLKLSFFQCLASRERIESKLGKGGFAKVRVFTSARELPADWPDRYRSKKGSCERYAEGIWARPTMPRNRPSSIEAWWSSP
jgi:hypothetical protein